MMHPSRLIFIAISLATVFLIVGGTILSANTVTETDESEDSLYKYLSVFTEVLGLVKRAYVDETESQQLMGGAVEGTVDALDPFSFYVPAERVESFLKQRPIGNARSGLTILKERGVAYVVSIVDGSPASEADLERGDVVSGLQGLPTRNMPLLQIQTFLAGPIGTEIKVERIRLGQTETVSFKLAAFEPPGVTLKAEQGAPVLRLASFHDSLRQDTRAILETLGGGTAEDPSDTVAALEVRDRLLIDLRGISGGSEQSAYDVAALFTKGELGSLLNRQKTLESYSSDTEPLWSGERLVVLIDRGTQGAAEILASVLHQRLGASLVGERSFGHSGRQNLIELSTGGRLQITDAFFTGPDGEPINKSLTPDVFVRAFVPEGEEADPVLDRGVEVLLAAEEPELKKAA